MAKLFFISVMILLAISSCIRNQQDDQEGFINFDRIQVSGGFISGIESSDKEVYIFKGIPYAAAPVNDLRWKAPAPVRPWEGVKKCDSFGASAMQPSPEPFYMWSEEFLIPEEPIDEDCLYLNVWTGAKNMNEKRPVIVWIHGGGFVSGSGSVPIYNGEALARKGVVFVNINYRLGIFGFFSHPELTRESSANASGNYGLMDQIAALEWVKDNIAEFGGDPENITIAGQSAGSASVAYLVASPLAKGLFQKAIAQSGAGLLCRTPGPESTALLNLQQAEQAGVQVAHDLQAASVNQLRNITASDLSGKVKFSPHPIIDGYVIPENVMKIYEENKENKIRLLTGWNEDDGIVMGGFEKANVYEERILRQWGAFGQELLRFYPATNDTVAEISQKDLQRDIVFGAQNYTLANLVSRQGKDTYVYRFTHKVPAGQYKDFGAFHTAEVPYVLNNLKFVNRPFEPIDYRLADTMSSYWINFAVSGNPNADGILKWPEYHVNSREIMFFGDHPKNGIITDTLSLGFLSEKLTCITPEVIL